MNENFEKETRSCAWCKQVAKGCIKLLKLFIQNVVSDYMESNLHAKRKEYELKDYAFIVQLVALNLVITGIP